jgi:hypothetical protein
VPTAAHRHDQVLRAREVHGVGDIICIEAACDQSGVTVDHCIPDSTGCVVTGVIGVEKLALQTGS